MRGASSERWKTFRRHSGSSSDASGFRFELGFRGLRGLGLGFRGVGLTVFGLEFRV